MDVFRLLGFDGIRDSDSEPSVTGAIIDSTLLMRKFLLLIQKSNKQDSMIFHIGSSQEAKGSRW